MAKLDSTLKPVWTQNAAPPVLEELEIVAGARTPRLTSQVSHSRDGGTIARDITEYDAYGNAVGRVRFPPHVEPLAEHEDSLLLYAPEEAFGTTVHKANSDGVSLFSVSLPTVVDPETPSTPFSYATDAAGRVYAAYEVDRENEGQEPVVRLTMVDAAGQRCTTADVLNRIEAPFDDIRPNAVDTDPLSIAEDGSIYFAWFGTIGRLTR